MPNPENVIGKGKQFKKGESGNPAGRPRKTVAYINEEMLKAGYTPATTADISNCYLMLINLEMDELTKIVNDKSHPALTRIVGKAILSGKGFDVIEKMLDRSLGKPTQGVDLSGTVSIAKIESPLNWPEEKE